MKFCALLILSLLTVLFSNRKSKIISYCYAVLVGFFFYVSVFLGELGLISEFVKNAIGEETFEMIREAFTASSNSNASYSVYEFIQFTLTIIILVVTFRLAVEFKHVAIKTKRSLRFLCDRIRERVEDAHSIKLWERRYLVSERLRC